MSSRGPFQPKAFYDSMILQEASVASVFLYLSGSVILKDLTSFAHSPFSTKQRVALYYRREFVF